MWSKYRNVKSSYNGNYFDSKLEAGYAIYLDQCKERGEIQEWRKQITKHLDVNGKHVCDYRLDFEVEYSDGRIEYVEVKGFWTPEARIKVKLFEAIYGVEIKVVKSLSNLKYN